MTYVCLIELGQFNAAFPMSDSVGYSFKGLFILFRKVAKETTVSFCFCAVVVCNLEHCPHSSRCTDNFIALPILVFFSSSLIPQIPGASRSLDGTGPMGVLLESSVRHTRTSCSKPSASPWPGHDLFPLLYIAGLCISFFTLTTFCPLLVTHMCILSLLPGCKLT